MNFRSVVRLGSTTVLNDGKKRIECNSVQSIKNSASKLLMKECFTEAGVKTADWWYAWTPKFREEIRNGIAHTVTFMSSKLKRDGSTEISPTSIDKLPYPIICKHIHGSRGTGNSLVNTKEELEQWMRGKTLSNYIFEKYYTYSKEYRIHCTSEGYFYACRKMLKRDTPENKRFQRHDDNCVWILENNADFDKPVNWDLIVQDCVKALNSLGLDIGAFDVKTQSSLDSRGRRRENPEWIIIESCSAPSFGEITGQKYLEQIPKVLINKFKNN